MGVAGGDIMDGGQAGVGGGVQVGDGDGGIGDDGNINLSFMIV